MTFEASLTRLEEIVGAIENRETDLETAMALYQEGLKLSKGCGEQLSHYENQVTLLRKESDGLFAQVPFAEA